MIEMAKIGWTCAALLAMMFSFLGGLIAARPDMTPAECRAHCAMGRFEFADINYRGDCSCTDRDSRPIQVVRP